MTEEERLIAAGADGCRIGWVVALGYGSKDEITRIEMTVEPSAASLLERMTGNRGQPVLAVDIPIGLPTFTSPRECDLRAREILGPRWMSVFNPPDRELLGCESYADVQKIVALRKAKDVRAKGLARQGHNIAHKIEEFDELIRGLTPYPSWLVEVHPEVSFRILAGEDLPSKKRPQGKRARRILLEQALSGLGVADAVDGLSHPKREVAEDDRLDACIALWSAIRVARGDAEILGGGVDAHGVPMRIVV